MNVLEILFICIFIHIKYFKFVMKKYPKAFYLIVLALVVCVLLKIYVLFIKRLVNIKKIVIPNLQIMIIEV